MAKSCKKKHLNHTDFPLIKRDGEVVLARSMSWYGHDRMRDSGMTDITVQCIADTVNLARYIFFQHTDKKQYPRFICYGNNAAPLAQAAAMLEADMGRKVDVYTLPSAGYSTEDAEKLNVYYGLSEKDKVEYYRDFYRSIGITPDTIVDAPANRPTIFIRPFGYMSASFNGIEEIMRKWVSESAVKRYPGDTDKQDYYRLKFYQKSQVIGIRSGKWHKEKTVPMQHNKWHDENRALEIMVPERISRSVRKLRSIVWMPTFLQNDETTLTRYKVNEAGELIDEQGAFIENTCRVLDAMAHYVDQGKDAPWQELADKAKVKPFTEIYSLEKVGRIVDQFRRGIARGKDSYLGLLERQGFEAQDDIYQRR